MTRNKNQHVLPHNTGWAVKGEGNSRNTFLTDRKDEAIFLAREIAKNQRTELVIHNRNGKIMYKNSYGNDPHPPKDRNGRRRRYFSDFLTELNDSDNSWCFD